MDYCCPLLSTVILRDRIISIDRCLMYYDATQCVSVPHYVSHHVTHLHFPGNLGISVFAISVTDREIIVFDIFLFGLYFVPSFGYNLSDDSS